MTTQTVEKPNLGEPVGTYGGRVSTHVRRLLERSNSAGSPTALTPTIVRKMRRHYQVASGLIVQSLPLIRAQWSIECEDDRIRDALTAAYDAIAFTVHRSMARALWAGYSPNTITWDDVTLGAGIRGIYPIEIRDLEPETCKPLTDAAGTFDGFEQSVQGTATGFERVYTLWITEGLESGNYYGRSILDAAMEPWQDFMAIRAFHARYLERFGEPVVICRAPAGSTIVNQRQIETIVHLNADAGNEPGDPGYIQPPAPIVRDNQDAALQVGENLRHHSVVALPSSLLFGADGKPTGYAWNLEYLESKTGGGTDFLEAEREFDKRIGRAMFVPDLLSQNTEDVGSNALGQTHKGVWEGTVEGRLDDYSRQITAQLLTPARILNFGPTSAPARLVFAPLTDAEKDRFWSLVVALVENGEIPIDVIELAERYDLPLLDDAEIAARQARRDAAAAAPAAGSQEEQLRRVGLAHDVDAHDGPTVAVSNPHGWAHAFAGVDPVAGLPEWKLPQSYDPPPFRRALNSREARVGFAKLEGGLNSSEDIALAGLDTVLDREHERILKQLSGIMRKGSEREILEGLGSIEIRATNNVARSWQELMGTVADLAAEQLAVELSAYAEQLKPVGPAGRALFKAYATTASERVVAGLVSDVRLQLLNAYTSGVGRAGMASIVGQVFDAYASSEGKPVRLTTRMLSAKSLNYSRAAIVEAGGVPLAGAQYSAVLDRRTCELCDDLDEKVIPIESTDLSRFTPPVHHNCRCLWVWITRDEADFTPTWSTPAATKVDRFGGLVIG